MTFFDPLYSLNRGRYKPGAVADVAVAGIAYSLKSESRDGNTATGMPAGGLLFCPRQKTDGSGLHNAGSFGEEEAFGLAYCMQPAPHVQADDYDFRAPVVEREEFQIDSMPASRFRATVIRSHRQDIELDIFATKEALKLTKAPGPGEAISGTIWLQGTFVSDAA